MKILVLNGSPKGEKSNTLQLTRAFCEGLEDAQAESHSVCKTEILPVCQMEIRDCLGCFSCWNKTPGKCCISDDMEQVIRRMLEADVIIWSFPLYYFGIPSRIKALMDRTLPMNLPFMSRNTESGGHPLRYDMSGKRFVVISTCGFYTAEGNYEGVDAVFSHLYGKNGYTSIYCGQGELFRVPQLRKRTEEYLFWVKRAGREFAAGNAAGSTAGDISGDDRWNVIGDVEKDNAGQRKDFISKVTREKLSQLLYPREMFEAMADASWGIAAPESAGETAGERETGQKETVRLSEAEIFTRQMAALYQPGSWQGKDQVLEFFYTDCGETYQILMGQNGYQVASGQKWEMTTRIETPLSVWSAIGTGEMDGAQAMMERRYAVKGNFDLLLHWDEYFGYGSVSETGAGQANACQKPADPPRKSDARKSGNQKTNMSLMLFPWILIWIAVAISPQTGGILGLAACLLLPFGFLRWKATIFEYITMAVVGAISLLAVLGAAVELLIPVSYLAFGLMWLVTAFLRRPLSAWYSVNDYGGEKMLKNPLFMRTNRILTACWGVLYVLSPLWTYPLMQTDLRQWSGAINSVLPALMGIFTLWFQRWYPAHYASDAGRQRK